jgi:hypothetical protein
MGNTRTEEKDPKYKVVSDLNWTAAEIKQRLADYENISNQVIQLSAGIPAGKKDAWFELIEYPVRAAAEMNKKHLYGQLARHQLASWASSDAAYENIVSLTQKYNSLGQGKWNKMMDYSPRKLSVFEKVEHRQIDTPLPNKQAPSTLLNGKNYNDFSGEKPLAHGLGYQQGAIALKKNSSVRYTFSYTGTDSLWIELALVPNHPVDGKNLRYEISVDGGDKQVIAYKTNDRDEEWKKNVLSNQALKKSKHLIKVTGKGNLHQIQIKAVDEGVMIDQLRVYKQ